MNPAASHVLARGSLPALLGLVPPLFVLLWADGPSLVLRLAVVLLVTLGWQVLFATVRRRGMELSGLVTGAALAFLVPAEAPLWHLVLASSFGIVLAEEIFGGRGRNFVHPAIAGLTFLMFSFSSPDYRAGPEIPALAILPAALLLLASGQAAWRVLLGAAAAMIAIAWSAGSVEPWEHLTSGAILLALIVLAADPVASAATQGGRWLYGALVGTLAGLFMQAGAPFGSVVFAILMASIFAPLLDWIAIALHMRWRERRHG